MTLTRRSLFKGGMVAAGSLLVGVDLGGCAFVPMGSAMQRHFVASSELKVAAWLRILPDDRIVLWLDRVEMGQGTMTGHAMLVAEELEVSPSQIIVEHAPSDRSFGNPEFANIQITGGSNSTKGAWKPLRRAGATARELLRRGAAEIWKVPLAECRAMDGAIHHQPSARVVRYGELLEAAARQDIEAAEAVPLKLPAEFRWIGRSLARTDARPKVDGSAIYGIDVRVPGMLTASIVRAPVRGATVRRFDAAAARTRPGVVDVIEVSTGIAVVANGFWAARRAADQLQVTWDPAPLARHSSPEMVAELIRMTEQPATVVRSQGRVSRALARAARQLESVYIQPFLAHATIEPQNATVWIRDGQCDVWAPTQAPSVAHRLAVEMTGLAHDRVRIHTTMIGGSFGRRTQQDYVAEALEVARHTDRPVQVVWSRADDFENDFYRPIAVARVRGGLDGDGGITAWHHRVVSPSIIDKNGGDFLSAILPDLVPNAIRRYAMAAPRAMARGLLPDPLSVEGAEQMPYQISVVQLETAHAEMGVPVGFWRSVGHSHNAMVVESFIDELLHAAGRDPYVGRTALLRKHPRLRAALDLAAAKAGWGSALPSGVGRGIAVHESFGSACAQVVEVEVSGANVRVRRVISAIECGLVINPQIVIAQIEGSVVYALSAALREEITFDRGQVQQRSFAAYSAMRFHECPAIEVYLVPSDRDPQGVGEPGVPPVAPALCNAIFAASGIRIRELPIERAMVRARAAAALDATVHR